MPSIKNQDQVSALKAKVDQAESLAVVEYEGTTVNEMVSLRSAIRQSGGELLVAKNRLVNIVVGDGKITDSLNGMNAIVLSNNDPVSAIKALFGFNKDAEKLTIKQGYMIKEDKVLSPAEVEALSKLPGKDELMVMLIQRLQGPAYGLANVLKAGQRNLVYALKAIADKQAQA